MRKLLFYVTISMLLVGIMPVEAQVIVGDPAPDFSYTDTDGKTFKLSNHRGNVVFMYLFGNTCPSCLAIGNKTEVEIHQAFSSNPNFTAVGLDMWDNSSSVASVSSFKSQTGITYPLLVKAGGVAASYSTSYDRIIIVDQDGVIRHKNNSLVSQDIDKAKLVIEEYLMTASINREIEDSENLKIFAYPNPARNILNLSFKLNKNSNIRLTIYNSIGHLIKSLDTEYLLSGDNTLDIDVSDLTEGMYFYRFDSLAESGLSGTFLVKR